MTAGISWGARSRDLLGRGHPAVLSTFGADGAPQSCVMWAGLDGDDLVMISRTFREPARAVDRDPRVSVLVYDRQRPTTYVQVRGLASLEDARTQEIVRMLTDQYLGPEAPHRPGPHVTIRLVPAEIQELVWE